MDIVSAEFAEALTEHNAVLIDGMESRLVQLRAIPKADRPKFVQGQINYWDHAIATLKWSTRVARQRAKINE